MHPPRRGFLRLLGAGAMLAASGPLAAATATPRLVFHPVASLAELERALKKADGRPTILWVRADWSISCKEMEQTTFTEPAVIEALADTVCLVADVTEHNDHDKALLDRFGVFGPPTFLLFDRDGERLDGHDIIGYLPAGKFMALIETAFNS